MQNSTAPSAICSNEFQDAGVPSRKTAAGSRSQHRSNQPGTAHLPAAMTAEWVLDTSWGGF